MNRRDRYHDVVRFHGHECPGAAFGVRVAEAALSRLGADATDAGAGLVLVSETDTCAVDALQVLTGCTFGKRNLIHKDEGRNVFTFWGHGEERGLRVRAKADSVAFRTDAIWALADRIDAGTASKDDEEQFATLQEERTGRLLEVPEEDFLVVDEVAAQPPVPKRLAPVQPCEQCGEPTSIEILHDHRGRVLCATCHLAAHDGVLPADHGDHGHVHHHHHHAS